MKKISSFKVDHTKLKKGIYLSRYDYSIKTEEIIATTFDIRMKLPNRETPLKSEVAHTIEHLGASFLRNNEKIQNQVIYWGPMGCLTGFYGIFQGQWELEKVIPYIKEIYFFIKNFTGEIPGATLEECGNYVFHNLREAKKEADIFYPLIAKV